MLEFLREIQFSDDDDEKEEENTSSIPFIGDGCCAIVLIEFNISHKYSKHFSSMNLK